MSLEGIPKKTSHEEMDSAKEVFDLLRFELSSVHEKINELKGKVENFLTEKSGRDVSFDDPVATPQEISQIAELLIEEAKIQEMIASKLKEMI